MFFSPPPPPSSPTEVLTFCCIGFLLTVSVKNQAMIFNLSPVISCSPIKFIFDISYITGSIYFACKNILLIVTCLFTTGGLFILQYTYIYTLKCKRTLSCNSGQKNVTSKMTICDILVFKNVLFLRFGY